MAKKWSHSELCKKAVSWLKRSHTAGGPGCPNAFSEAKSGSNGGEIADALGIKTSEGTESIVIEVKTSRSDFLADKKKPFRKKTSLGMGNFRYYLCPEGLIKKEDLPNKWGLIYVGLRGKLTVICGHRGDRKEKWYFDSNRDAELGVLSILMSKAGDFEILAQTMRSNVRLENKVKMLEDKIQKLEFNDRHNEIIDSLKELQPLTPIPKTNNQSRLIQMKDQEIEKLIENFGLTHIASNAGFILPDGRMLDLNRNKDKSYHFEALNVLDIEQTDKNLAELIREKRLVRFCASGLVHVENMPTKEQLETIYKSISYRSNEFIFLLPESEYKGIITNKAKLISIFEKVPYYGPEYSLIEDDKTIHLIDSKTLKKKIAFIKRTKKIISNSADLTLKFKELAKEHRIDILS